MVIIQELIYSVKGTQMQDISTSIKWMIHARSHMRNIYANIIVPRLRNNYIRLTEKSSLNKI